MRQQVLALAGFGMTHDQIAKVMDLSDETLRKYYRNELDIGTTKLNAQVAQNLFKIATGKDKGAVTAAIFWLKTRARWTERIDISNEDGSLKPEATQVAVIAALNKIPDREQNGARHRALIRLQQAYVQRPQRRGDAGKRSSNYNLRSVRARRHRQDHAPCYQRPAPIRQNRTGG
jgi:hypothetical protein